MDVLALIKQIESSEAPTGNLIILSDFDGTILTVDTCVNVLQKFAKEDWKKYDALFEKGEMTLEGCLQRQFSSVTATKSEILKETEKAFSTRTGFQKLVEFCDSRLVPLVIVSAGLDFVIEHFLKQKGLYGLLEVYAPKARFTGNGIAFTFPELFDKAATGFKEDVVTHYKRQGKKVVYIGDGQGDFPAARHADLPFAVKGSKLSKLLEKEGTECVEIVSLEEVIRAIAVKGFA